jgi:hypothetical protein
MSSIAVYSSALNVQIDIIRRVKAFFKSSDELVDFLIFSDDIASGLLVDTAILSTFYMTFYPGQIIFLNVEDYLANKNNLLTNDYVLLLDFKDALEHKLDISLLKNTQILKYDNDKMELMQKYEV